ncbi:multicopper oxidase domain-containing protein [Nonomuraea sp. NPDC050451]
MTRACRAAQRLLLLPGIWMIHCHNIYHAESGMMTLLGYQQL